MARTWNRKRLLIGFIGLLVLWKFFFGGYDKYEISGIINSAKPKDVWEFVADFSKMMKLNPTIKNFKIISDTGNFDHWKYSVIYEEKLSHWPYWSNIANADYSVRYEVQPDNKKHYIVASNHRTCFFMGLVCYKSEGVFDLTESNTNDTYYIERVRYQCPPFFGSVCRREVEYQRLAILENLRMSFKR